MFLWQRYAASEFKHKIALREHAKGDVFTWRRLAEKIDDTAALLRSQGIEAGAGVALCGKNGLNALCCYLAALQLNMRVLGLNPAFPAEKIARLCAQNAIDLLIVSDGAETELKKLAENRPHFRAGRALTMTLTSGSSGLPKAVIHDIEAHLANARGVCELMRFGRHDGWLLSLPLYHVSGQGIVWRWLLQGAELHLPAKDFCRSVTLSTHASLVPVQLQRFLAWLQDNPGATYHTRRVLLGGSQIPTELTAQLGEFGIQSYSGYGMTEMASTVCAKPSDERGGVGRPLSGREYCLVNDEIWLRGAGLGLGYWRNGSVEPLTNAQGWLQTRDKGYERDGELVVCGRLDNMFISGGENIQPEEIESIIQRFDEVEQVFVLPVPDAEFGRRPVAMVKFKTQFSPRAVNELRIWLSDKIEKFKQPTAYFALDDEKLQCRGAIKISRAALAAELTQLIGKR